MYLIILLLIILVICYIFKHNFNENFTSNYKNIQPSSISNKINSYPYEANPYDNNFYKNRGIMNPMDNYGNKIAYDLDNTFSGHIPNNTPWDPNTYTLRQTSDGKFVGDFSGN